MKIPVINVHLQRNDALSLAASVALPLVGGMIGGMASQIPVLNWYTKLKKPKWTPPKAVFPIVWPLMYASQGLASWLVWRTKIPARNLPLALYGAQLLLNWAWQPLFFNAKRLDLAMVDITAMLGFATAATVSMANVATGHKGAVIGLMTPYLAWMTFAAALNYKIMQDNPNADKIKPDPIKDAVPKDLSSAAQTAKTK